MSEERAWRHSVGVKQLPVLLADLAELELEVAVLVKPLDVGDVVLCDGHGVAVVGGVHHVVLSNLGELELEVVVLVKHLDVVLCDGHAARLRQDAVVLVTHDVAHPPVCLSCLLDTNINFNTLWLLTDGFNLFNI